MRVVRTRPANDLPFELLDVFTDRPLAGNQLAVFPDAAGIDEALLQPLARETNLAETVFVLPPRSDGHAALRIFTTVTEVPFAGHPVLGTACLLVLTAEASEARAVVRLETGRGTIPVEVERRGEHLAFGRMSQPVPDVRTWEGDVDALVAALGAPGPVLPLEVYDNGIPHLFVMLPRLEDVLAIEPDLALLRRLTRGPRINCFAEAEGGSRYTTRMFSPFDYVPEDPATGSAAGPLAAHLVRHGLLDSGTEIVISQGEKVGRPSRLYASAEFDGEHLVGVRVGGYACRVGGGHYALEVTGSG